MEIKYANFMENLSKALEEDTEERKIKIVMIESPSNPLMHMYDIEAISYILREHKTKHSTIYPFFVVDNTFSTPIFQNPLLLGADIVIHSATKFLGGHSDACSGILSFNDPDLNQ